MAFIILILICNFYFLTIIKYPTIIDRVFKFKNYSNTNFLLPSELYISVYVPPSVASKSRRDVSISVALLVFVLELL
jgi:hypothetical protein